MPSERPLQMLTMRYPLYKKYKKASTQKARKLPIMIPSRLFLADILPMSVFIPGIWLAAPVILLLMLANVSLCKPKLSLTA